MSAKKEVKEEKVEVKNTERIEIWAKKKNMKSLLLGNRKPKIQPQQENQL